MTTATLIAASLINVAAEESEHHGNVALETFWYGAVALVVFALLALVTLSYRNVANRHAHKAEAYTRTHGTPQPDGHGH
jgi:heme/copper-type cytochrome/quinol oxidase subunit 2